MIIENTYAIEEYFRSINTILPLLQELLKRILYFRTHYITVKIGRNIPYKEDHNSVDDVINEIQTEP